MKDKIEKLYVDAINADLPPNVFAEQVLRLFDVICSAEESRCCLICGYFCNNHHHENSWYDNKKA